MKPFIFRGPPVNLGSHGHVKPGQTVWLPDDEAQQIQGDKRFEPTTIMAGMAQPDSDSGLAELKRLTQPKLLQLAEALRDLGYPIIPRGSDDSQTLIMKIKEARRFDPAQFEGRAGEVAAMLAQRTKDELQDYCRTVQAQPGKTISWNQYMSRMELVCALIGSKWGLDAPEAPADPEPPKAKPSKKK